MIVRSSEYRQRRTAEVRRTPANSDRWQGPSQSEICICRRWRAWNGPQIAWQT